MSHTAIAAALACDDISAGERLVAFSLASFADRDGRAFPGLSAAAARTGLGKSRYLQARDQLARRGLVVVEQAAGRGRSSTVTLAFAETGPWWEGEINADLFEAALSFSSERGPGRLLLAVLAGLANVDGRVEGVTTDRLCAAAGISDRTYRRARQALIGSGAITVDGDAGGRGITSRWTVRDPRVAVGALATVPARRVAPPARARPLLATVPAGPETGDATRAWAENPGQDRTDSAAKGPIRAGVSGQKGGQDRTLSAGSASKSPAETPAKTPAETPAPNARAGSRGLNPRTPEDPPTPLSGGRRNPDTAVLEETVVTKRGRRRRRSVVVDLDEVRRGLAQPSPTDRGDWEQIRSLLAELAGQSTFEIWLASLELAAVDASGALVIGAPAETVGWVRERFGALLTDVAVRVGRGLRIAEERERIACGAVPAALVASDVYRQATNRRVS